MSKSYDKHKNDKRNNKLMEYYKRKQKEYRKKCKDKKRQQKHYENETIANEEAMATTVKHLTTQILPKVTSSQKVMAPTQR